jgi:hypothetical protein
LTASLNKAYTNTYFGSCFIGITEATFFFLLHSEWDLGFVFCRGCFKVRHARYISMSFRLCHSDNVAVGMHEDTRHRSAVGLLKESEKETAPTQKVQHCIIVHCQDIIAAGSTCAAPALPLQSEGMPRAISMLLGTQCSLILMPL